MVKFWNSNANAHPLNAIGHGGGDRWWSIEELGEGASVVRSKTGAHGQGVDREVWVLRVGSDDHDGSMLSFMPCTNPRCCLARLTFRSTATHECPHPLPPSSRSTSSRISLSQTIITIPNPPASSSSPNLTQVPSSRRRGRRGRSLA